MMDDQGKLVTDHDAIKDMDKKAYTERLRKRPIKEGLENLKEAKERLAEKVMQVAKDNKTDPWNIDNLNLALKSLKNHKSRDPNDSANEIFKPDVAGEDLNEAILKLMNRIKTEQIYPKCLELCNITSIWKQKGPRNKFSSYRGIFRVSVFRSILDKLIYNGEYENIDANLTDSKVGGRRCRNIRDNIIVLNAILNSKRRTLKEDINIQVYAVEQCFDSLWLHEVILSLYQAGFKNDKLPLLFLENRNAQVAIKTTEKLSDRMNIKNIIMQGSVWGSLCCVFLMDKLGKLSNSNPDLLYMYKGVAGCPPLQMVDDVLSVQTCSEKSQLMKTTVNTFMELEKLTLSKTKCHKIHIGKHHRECSDLLVHGEVMSESKAEKYLGDIIHNSCSIKPNLARQLSRGWGKLSEILAIIKEAPLGNYKIMSGFILRKAMLLNTMLFNSEAWHSFNINQVEAFEKIDEALIRGLVLGHSKIPILALYLETGQVPIRFILACRRILYLKTILKRDPDELIFKVYAAQATTK